MSDEFLQALVTQVTTGLGGKVAMAPRLFLRELVDVMDRVDQHEGYDPARAYKLTLDEATLTTEELAAKRGQAVVEESEVESTEAAQDEGAEAKGKAARGRRGARIEG